MITDDWIQRTMANMDKLLSAVKFKKRNKWEDGKPPTGQVEEQQAYVDKSLERCPRCGDHVWGLVADPINALSKLCPACDTELRAIEEQFYIAKFPTQKPPIWFRDMVKLATEKEDKS